MPQIAVGWKPRAWNAPERGHADPRHDLVAADDRREQLAAGRRRSPRPAAIAAGQTTTLTCATESECVSSKSRPWQSIAFANAAFAAGRPLVEPDHRRLRRRRRARPSPSGPRSRRRARARRGRSRSCRAGGASPPRRPRPGSSLVGERRRPLGEALLQPSSHTLQSRVGAGEGRRRLGRVALVDHERPLELDHDLAAAG